MSVSIYKATNKDNGKSYIGLTETMQQRRTQHFVDALSKLENNHFHNALRKYNKNKWVWTVLVKCETREEAGEIEKQMIVEYDTLHNGYNSTTGGERGWTHSPEACKKMSISSTGKRHSKEARLKMSKSRKGIPRGPFSPEHRRKLSEFQKGIPRGPNSKEHNKKISRALKGRIPWNKGRKSKNVE